jgi:hypothetical protein
MFERFKEIFNYKFEPKDEPMLIEDIQLYMCSNQPRIADFWVRMRNRCFIFSTNHYREECPRPRLDTLSHYLDRISSQLSDSVSFGAEILPLKHYYGYEEPTEPAWQSAAPVRAKGLLFDAKMLYHLLHFQLNSDVRMLIQIAKDRSENLPFQIPEIRQQEREQRVSSATTWTATSLARRSLCHAAAVLVLHQQNKELDIRTLDPIAYVALATAALVVWAYCTFGGESAPDPSVALFAELTKLCGGCEKGREAWIDMGAGIPTQIGGVRLCESNTLLLVGRFRAFIPDDWELADSIAPGIFNAADRRPEV